MRRTWWILDVSPRPEGPGFVAEFAVQDQNLLAQVVLMIFKSGARRVSHDRGGTRHFVAITLQ
ncbi:hypothetical protein V441_05340 [Pseudomonas aeruginosa DHS29]|nr:hypothetical protein HW05_26590 [Pseudomonas aeruginosa]AMA39028.1 hypothetical protein DPADHS01_24090 [Pseudomonas aeruginosa DHS01]ESZ84360.1 hypothetical protein V441_05340 [Pseudomonas aeruginosa DHS29]ETD50552.1 hypothetical protein X778_18865 [Pseudomonas aeruginosa VRFPA07]KUI89403.1 hypothetical protein ASV59_12115 [Pseudomonas aeruginosa 0C2E]OFM77620.1 hypothetical protein HMPREF2666_03130 [Pseudomonas sp. HMSC058C05]